MRSYNQREFIHLFQDILQETNIQANTTRLIRFHPTNLMRLIIYNYLGNNLNWRATFFFDDSRADSEINDLIALLDHNDLQNINAGTDYEHITQTQKDNIHALLDEDDMASNSETSGASQQSIKSFVHNLLSGLEIYLHQNASADIGGYRLLDTEFPDDAKTEIFNTTITSDNQEIEQFITAIGVPARTEVLEGFVGLHAHGYKFSGAKDIAIYFKLYSADSDGANENLIATSEHSALLGDSEGIINIHALITEAIPIDTTDRIVLKIFAHLEGTGNNPVIYFYVEGTTMTHFNLPLSIPTAGVLNHNDLANLNVGTVYEHISAAQVAALAEHAAYIVAQHNREISPCFINPQDKDSGVDNVYWGGETIVFGKTSHQENHALFIFFILPGDYIDGEDLNLILYWRANLADDINDYQITPFYARDGVGNTSIGAINGTWTAGDTNFDHNYEEITIPGTDVLKKDNITIRFEMEDDNNVNASALYGIKLSVPVNGRD